MKLLHVAATGHRLHRVSTASLRGLEPQVRALLDELNHAQRRLWAPEPARLVLLSALAEGADRMLAEAALAAGHELHALLPFGPAAYRRRMAGPASRTEFDGLLGQASEVSSLDGVPGFSDAQHYARLGRRLVARADVLLAIWDGGPAEGPGGTADVVRLALEQRVPVLHLGTGVHEPPRLLWRSGEADPPARPVVPQPCTPAALDAVLLQVLARPAA